MDFKENNPKLIWRWRIKSKTRKDLYHIVEVYSNGDMRCSCEAHQWDNPCWHLEKVKKFLNQLVYNINKKYGKQKNV